MQCSQALQTKEILIVLGDTFFEFPKISSTESNKNYVLVSPVNEYYRWCITEYDSSNKITSFIDKPNSYSGNGDALIGVYKINDWPLFHTCLQSAWQNKKTLPKKVELSIYSAIENHFLAKLPGEDDSIPPGMSMAPASDAGPVTVLIEEAWCKACDICVKLCPERCLELNGTGAVNLTDPAACTGCRICEMLCPDFAIRVTA